jgi:hypothetical protein
MAGEEVQFVPAGDLQMEADRSAQEEPERRG